MERMLSMGGENKPRDLSSSQNGKSHFRPIDSRPFHFAELVRLSSSWSDLPGSSEGHSPVLNLSKGGGDHSGSEADQTTAVHDDVDDDVDSVSDADDNDDDKDQGTILRLRAKNFCSRGDIGYRSILLALNKCKHQNWG